MASCGCLYHQKCLEKHILTVGARCPNMGCRYKDIETSFTSDISETGTQDPMEISPQLSTIAGQKDLSSFMTGDPQLFESDPLQSDTNNKAQEKDTAHTIDENASPLKPTTEICSKCSESISSERSKPVVLLTCKHVIHFECIASKRNLCPKCPSADDLEKEGYYISPSISLNEAPKKKRKKEEDNVHENKPRRIPKPQVIIRELSVVEISDESSITAPSEDSNMEEISTKLYRLYYEVDNVEKSGNQTNRNVIYRYFQFGKALSERLIELLKSKPPQTTYTELNGEVREHLPKNLNNAMVRKRTDTARKIYDVFSKIGEDKISRVKSFTASSFSDLTRSEVKYIIENFPSDK
ncbi:1221_t:CDS:1 [Ambispora leptoticha]|uniref:1221_t:CDS:1 n=1 Tax=Ambispora leptoticha TaxID=144679 RepID=A0A9N9FJQ4_9GLOM|nr:1221_t:CDS:1 [Ambispora leptoticha]